MGQLVDMQGHLVPLSPWVSWYRSVDGSAGTAQSMGQLVDMQGHLVDPLGRSVDGSAGRDE